MIPFFFVSPPQSLLPAERVLNEAKAQAKREGKRVFLMFGATWCVPCKLSERFIRTGPISQIWARHYVLVKVVGFKRKPTDEENAGAEALMERYLGKRQILPSHVILDERGKLLTDFYHKVETGESIRLGIPPGPAMAGAFLRTIHSTTPKMTMNELRSLRGVFDREIDLRDFAPTGTTTPAE